jgi:hypothetical protein
MRARSLFPVLALAATLAGPAAAQGKDPAAATALFQEGREAAKKGDYATACVKMDASFRLDPAVGTLLNLADCHERLGHLATAWQRFQEAADKLPPADDRLASVKQRLTALGARLPRLAVTIAPGAPPDTRVMRDGVALAGASLGTPLPVDPGAHEIVASAAGREDRRYPLDAGEGRTDHVTVEPGAPAGRTAPAPPEPPTAGAEPGRGSTLRVAGFVVGGLGVATLAAAVGTGLALPGKQSTVDQHCGAAVHLPADRCDAVGFAAAQSGKTLATANTATWVAGGIAAAAGFALVVVGFVGKDPAAPVQVGVQVGAAAGGAGAVISGRFQ